MTWKEILILMAMGLLFAAAIVNRIMELRNKYRR